MFALEIEAFHLNDIFSFWQLCNQDDTIHHLHSSVMMVVKVERDGKKTGDQLKQELSSSKIQFNAWQMFRINDNRWLWVRA